MKKFEIKYYFLVFLGLLNIFGYLIDSKWVRGIAIASAASPLPLVFSHFRGMETFAVDVEYRFTLLNGEVREGKISPEVYSNFNGPYNLRNVYGAAIAYGPKLTRDNEPRLVQSVLKRGFCQQGLAAIGLGIKEPIKGGVIAVKSRTANSKETWNLDITCP